MVNREQRDVYVSLIEEFYSGGITNFEYENRCDEILSMQPPDPAVDRIHWELWHTYDGIREHRMTGEDVLTAEGYELLDKFKKFLRTDLDYAWPDAGKLPSFLLALLTLGIYPRLKMKRIKKKIAAYGDLEHWPFRNEEEYNFAG